MKETIIISIIGIAFCGIVLVLFGLLTKELADFQKRKLAFLILVVLIVDLVLTMIPDLEILKGLQWNWQGKFFSIVWALLFIYSTKTLTKQEVGFTIQVDRSSWVSFFILCILGIAFRLYDIFSEGGIEALHVTTEELLYQLSMPGLSEELIYRGIILALLNKMFQGRTRILGGSIGWGVVIQAIIFGGGHSFYFDESGHIQFALTPAIITGIIGFIFGWLRERSGSIVLPIVFHNLFNGFPRILALFN